MSKTIYCDVDSTIYDLFPLQKEAALKRYGVELKRNQIDRWNWCYRMFGDDGFELFKDVLTPENIERRELYDGAKEALERLYDLGFNLYFLSHHWSPREMEAPVREWLHSEIDRPLTVKLMGARNCKVEFALDDPTTGGIIEDKPSTLAKANKKGVPCVAIQQLWNMETIDTYNLLSVTKWFEMPELIMSMRLGTNYQERLDFGV